MPVFQRATKTVQRADDGPGALSGGDDGKVLTWDNATGKFVMATGGGGSTFTSPGETTTLGSEMLTNADFATNLSGWTAAAEWTYDSGGALHAAGGAGWETLTQAVTLTAGQLYRLSIEVSGSSGDVDDGADIYFTTDSAYVSLYGYDGTAVKYFHAGAGGADTLIIEAPATFSGHVLSVSLKEVTPVLATLQILNSDASNDLQIRAGGNGNEQMFVGLGAGEVFGGTTNTGLGFAALQYSDTGTGNVAVGHQALQHNLGNFNVALGSATLKDNRGASNTAIGNAAMGDNTAGSNNVALGDTALGNNEIGDGNLAIGAGALVNGRNISGCIGIGNNAGANNTTDNKLFIANNDTTPIIEGTLDVSAANQLLQINATLGEAWTGLTYTNAGGTTWADYGSGYQVGQYKKFGDMVLVRGLATRSAGSGATIATLPSGYRPSTSYQLFATLSDSGVARVDIDTSGNIVLSSGGAGWVALNFVLSIV